MRRAEAREGGDEHHTSGVGDRPREFLGGRRVVDDAQLVAQPLDDGSAREGAALQRETRLAAPVHGEGRQEACGGVHPPRARVEQEEAAGAVGRLHRSGLEATLPEERGLLIPEHAVDRHRLHRAQQVSFTERAARGHDLGQARLLHAEELEERRRVAARADVEEHRATRVGGVGDPALSAREVMDDEPIDGQEPQVPGVRRRAYALVVRDQPLRLGRGEIRVDHQPGPRRHLGGVAGLPQLRAARRRPAVLPDDARSERLPVAAERAKSVSRWFVMPIATGDPPAPSRARPTVSSTAARMSSARCSTRPGEGKRWGNSA